MVKQAGSCLPRAANRITPHSVPRFVPRFGLRLAPLAAAVLGVFASANSRADWTVRPGIELRETYTDNVALQPDDRAESQFVTEINPSLRVEHRGPRLNLNTSARLNYFLYSDKEVSGTQRFYKQFSGNGRFEAIEDTLFVEASGFHGPRSVSPFGQQLTDNPYASANRTQVSSWSLSPYFTRRFGSSANMVLRYTRDSVDTGNSGFGTSEGNALLFNLGSGTAFNTVAWNLRLSRQDIDQKRVRAAGSGPMSGFEQNTSAQVALASARYILARTFHLTGSLGYDKYDYSALGGVTEGRSWTTGFAWSPSPRTSLEVSAGQRYIGSTKSLAALHRSRRTTWRISYSDGVTNTRATSLLPATFDTAALLDTMFLPSIPDEAQRRLAVEQYIRAANLPPALVESVSFLSNRYFLQKQLNASAAFKLPRTTGILNLYRTRSDALTSSATDSALLGSTLSSYNDNTIQKGGSLTLTYALSPRSALRLTRSVTDNESLGTARDTYVRTLRMSATRTLAKRLVAGVEVRNNEGTSLSTNYRPYRERAIAAFLTYQR